MLEFCGSDDPNYGEEIGAIRVLSWKIGNGEYGRYNENVTKRVIGRDL